MDMSKFEEIFKPWKVKERIHIIGCGSVGSTIGELLARYGFTKFDLYDFDKVEPKNIANQMFRDADIGSLKVDALEKIITEINPEAKKDIQTYPQGYTDQPLTGYVFLAVDNIELRKKICESIKYSAFVKAVFDVRTGLYDAQHFAADWRNLQERKRLIDTMQFSQEEAKIATPVSACGVEFGVAPTIRMVCNVCVANFINFLQGKGLKNLILVNPFDFDNDSTVVVA